MSFKPRYNSAACRNWIDELIKDNILERSPELRLKTPFDIKLPSSLSRKFTSTYKNNEETGGLLFCKINTKHPVVMEIVSFHQVPNVVEEYYPELSKSFAYVPDTEIYLELLSKNFSASDHRDILFPIDYHTHPSIELQKKDLYINTSSKLKLSPEDKDWADQVTIEIEEKLIYLNAILTGDESEFRIVYYGKDISPYEFDNVMIQQSIQGVFDITDEIEDDGLKVVARMGAGLGWVLARKYGVAHLLPSMLHDLAKRKKYLGTVSLVTDTVINIPKYDSEK